MKIIYMGFDACIFAGTELRMFTFEPVPVDVMESQEGINALFLYANEGILVVDDKGQIVSVNPSAERLFGYEKSELQGKRIEMLIPQRFSQEHQQHREQYHERPRARSMGLGMELFGLKKDGTEFPVEISLSPYTSEKGRFVIAFIIDVSIRKQAEEKLKNYSAELEQQVRNRTLILEEAIDELQKTKKELNEALAKEKDLNELKSRFVSMASHEFRTPLATILSSLSLVTRYGEMGDTEKQMKHIERIKSSINNLTDILNDFLSISKLEEGCVENNPEPMDIEEYVLAAISELQNIAGESGIVYTHEGRKNVTFDPKLLRHIFYNLVSNAIKFSTNRGPVEVSTVVKDGMLTLTVRDKGIGISKEDQEHLFERFFRGQNATHIQGTGLGLNIVARHVELMGGTIKLQSKEFEGTTVTVRIPV